MFFILYSLATSKIRPLRIDGLVAAVYSPLDAKGNLELSVIPLQAAYLNATGVEWVFVSGTTGESLSLTVAERKSLFSAWASTGSHVIAHVGAESVADAKDLAAHALSVGARAIGLMAPSFFKAATAPALAATVADVCRAAPSLPCYYYHIPSMTGVNIDMLSFVKAIESLSANFAGIKYTGSMLPHTGGSNPATPHRPADWAVP